MIKLIVGLGNIGEQYHNTRHNIGFKLLDSFAKKQEIEFNRTDFQGVYSILTINDTKVILLKPSTYMNLSGNSVIACMNFFKIKPDEIIVVYDDKDLKVGEYKYKSNGSAGGHNGMKHIIQMLGTEEIKRIKIGIGPKPPQMDLANFVLAKFSKEETEKLSQVINIVTNQLKQLNVKEFSNLSANIGK